MHRNLLISILLVLATMPAATAHLPPSPILSCQNTFQQPSAGKYHEYLPLTTGVITIGNDGNIDGNCPKPDPMEVGVFSEGGLVCTTLNGPPPPPTGPVGPPICGSVNTGVPQPILDYDGELDFGIGGAWLFYETGDGVTSGVTACYGWPSVGHHAGAIYAQDVLGNGPLFIVTADYSLLPPLNSPDCGDNIVDPCNATVPPALPFPANVIVATVIGVYNLVTNNPGTTCNPLDQAAVVNSTAVGPNRWSPTFGPGIDGSYVVFLRQDYNNMAPSNPGLAVAGHVWTN